MSEVNQLEKTKNVPIGWFLNYKGDYKENEKPDKKA
jgi:hypothetical protein